MRCPVGSLVFLMALLSAPSRGFAAGEYPMVADVEARAQTATASVAAKLSISVDRLMERSRHVRVTDALKYGGYLEFFKVLRALPPVGLIDLSGRQVEIRYAHEQPHNDGRRVVLVADRPLFFLGGDPAKSRAGYELTMVELIVNASGSIVGTMTGAARVKLGPDGTPVVDDFAQAPVRLEGRVRRP